MLRASFRSSSWMFVHRGNLDPDGLSLQNDRRCHFGKRFCCGALESVLDLQLCFVLSVVFAFGTPEDPNRQNRGTNERLRLNMIMSVLKVIKTISLFITC